MRTKALILAAAIAAVGALNSAAQTVYSVNAVGYVNLPIPAGWSMIANPLNAPTNTLGALITTAPDFTTLYKWNGVQFTSYTFAFGEWDNPSGTLNPGEGCFVWAPESFTNTFVGEVMQGSLTNAIPVGFSMRASIVPQAGTAGELGLSAALADFDTIYKWHNSANQYVSHTWAFGEWDNEPTFAVGEAFWVNATASTRWVRNFSVNQ